MSQARYLELQEYVEGLQQMDHAERKLMMWLKQLVKAGNALWFEKDAVRVQLFYLGTSILYIAGRMLI